MRETIEPKGWRDADLKDAQTVLKDGIILPDYDWRSGAW